MPHHQSGAGMLYVPQIKDTEWGNYFIDCLIKCDRFQIEYESFPGIRNLGRRAGNLKPLTFDGKLILIDDWDWAFPTSLINETFFDSNPYYRELALILKVQFSTKDKGLYPNVPVVPFLMFPRSTFQLSVFHWEAPGKFITSFSGKGWRSRKGWISELSKMPDAFLKVENPNVENQQEYYEMLSQNTWGLILKGRGNGGKNRREVEYLSCGMPLALNYVPEYPFDFVPNVDFLHLNTPQDLAKLREIDPRPFSLRSIHNYETHFSPQGIASTFERLVRSHL